MIIFFSQILIVYLMPYPYNQINITILFLLWQVIYKGNRNYLWFAPIITLTTDLFSSMPFGLTTAVMIAAVTTVRKIFEFFSNFSWYNIFILALLGTFFYKFYSYLFLQIIYLFDKNAATVQLPGLTTLIIEILINALTLLIAYLAIQLFTKRKINYQSI